MDKIVKEFLEKYGYKDCIDENQETRVKEWLDIFKGPTKKYKIKIYNGKSFVPYTIKSLNLPSQMCADLADFYFNEKLDITIDNERVQKKINACLEQNKFLHNGNKLMQLTKALGTGAFVPYLENGVLKINYVNATNIIILKANSDEVIDVLFWSKTKTKDGWEYYFNLHILEEDGYVIRNEKIMQSGKIVSEVEIDETIKEIRTKSYLPKFGMIFTPEINNFDINSPYGISCYANALDEIFATDRAYDSLDNEIALGKKRVYVSTGALSVNINESGEPVPVFDSNDIAYYALPGDQDNEMIKESSFNLRIQEISDSIQYNLNLTTSKVGLGHNYYKFKDGQAYVNTDNVLSSNSDVYRKIKKQQNIITYAITNLIYAIAELIGIRNKFSISIFYDDTIIEDTEKTQKQAQSEYNIKLISKAQYYRDVYKLKDAEAIKFANKMNKEIMDETITDGFETVGDE